MAWNTDHQKTPEEYVAHIRAVRAENSRRWRANNPLKHARYALRYWQRKVAELEAAEYEARQTNGD